MCVDVKPAIIPILYLRHHGDHEHRDLLQVQSMSGNWPESLNLEHPPQIKARCFGGVDKPMCGNLKMKEPAAHSSHVNYVACSTEKGSARRRRISCHSRVSG